ncbi:MAG: ATP-binding protein [Verrucomicrobia bacterium]|nr:ATP-binding protein [Verrucomicrobiota bacterium]
MSIALFLVGALSVYLFWTLRRERAEEKALLEILGEGVVVLDEKLHIRLINRMGLEMLSLQGGIGKSFPHSTPLLQKCLQLIQICMKQQCAVTDAISHEEKRKVYFDLIAVPRRHGALLILQDKSSHQKVLEMGKNFVSNASHELRTPITIVKGFAETLQDLPELPREMVTAITEKIVRSCQRMDTLVKSLLTLADLENLPTTRFQECDLVAMAETCRQLVLSVYEKAEITIEKNAESITVDADPDILELALMNLLDNAAKYSSSPAQIQIVIREEKGRAHITVQDRGIGIPATDLGHIFERFYRVDKARSRRLGGAGLGLSIVKTIIEKHSGTIEVSSEAGYGTTFSINLPINNRS